MRVLLLLTLLWLAAPLLAQPQSTPARRVDGPLQTVTAQEATKLRSVLAAPLPKNARAAELRRRFDEKSAAALRLGDTAAQRAVLLEAIERMPNDARWRNDLGNLLLDEGRWDESRRNFEAAIERARNPAVRVFYESNLVRLLVARYADDAGARLVAVRQVATSLLGNTPPSNERVLLLRALGKLARSEVLLLDRRGRLADQLAQTLEAERFFGEALNLAQTLKDESDQRFAAQELALAQRDRAGALRRLGRIGEAETLLLEHLQALQKRALPAGFAAGAHHALAALRMAQREFAQSERQLRLALQVLDKAGVTKIAPTRIDKMRDLVLALWAQGRYENASRELDLLDKQVAGDKAATAWARIRFERGLVYLNTRRQAEAARLFQQHVERVRGLFGAGHFYVAQASGLQGVALWQHAEQRSDAQGRAQAADLLRQAVLDYLSPRNADFLDDTGVRKLVRDLVFATYVDAMAQRGGMQALLALGVADHLRSGVTPQAMADAAIRAAANDPALADLVREEQDARNELRAIQESLRASEAGEAPPPEVALRLRERSADLERVRQQLQERIRDRFPGYDQLVRPPVPSFTDVAQRLGRDEAFVMLTPTARALYVWAITADEAPLFARVDVTAAQLAVLVPRLRRTVDIVQMQGRLVPFDAAAAHELYRHLLAPVAPRLKSQRHLIIAASGPLAMLPFATLHTAPAAQGAGKKGSESLPWLVRQVSVTQVPSVSAWLALRQLPRSHPAPEPLLAWGDPAFALKVASKPKSAVARRQLAVTRRTQPPEATAAAPAVRYDELPPLPETRDELIAIARALKANVDRDVVLGAKATRDSVLAANREGQLARKRVVAFATHGLVAGDLPGLQQPALAMAAASSTAEPLRLLLTLDDVLTLKLNADWVVLSACNTAAAEGKAGEALSGLARGFFYAGARTLLVTQWAVETESAVLLTTSTFAFYTANPNASKAESLRQAMLRVMQTPGYEHPAFWAPYTLVGDGGR